MWIYTFNVGLLIKELPSFSIGQLNVIIIIVHIHILLFLCHSQRHTFQGMPKNIFQGTPKVILKPPYP